MVVYGVQYSTLTVCTSQLIAFYNSFTLGSNIFYSLTFIHGITCLLYTSVRSKHHLKYLTPKVLLWNRLKTMKPGRPYLRR